MSLRSAVVIVVDRLGAGFLGPYGNTWLDTPAVNSLASRSLLVETVIADSPVLADACGSYWTGRHALASGGAAGTGSGVVSGEEPLRSEQSSARNDSRPLSLAAALVERDVATVLVTDEPLVAEHPLAAAFERLVLVPQLPVEKCAAEADHTGLARLFAAAAETLAALAPPYLLWIHCRGMAGPWDAPLEFREQFRDEEDPLPGEFVAPPQQRIGQDFDPDELLKLQHAYAGQVSLLDAQLAGFLEMTESRGEAERLLAVTSPRGYPLGEHGRVGPCDEPLYAELLQVPLLVEFPRQQGALVRSAAILQPADLGAAVAEHFGLPLSAPSVLFQIARNEDHLPREAAVAAGADQRAIRTPAWFLREVHHDEQRQLELFAKPDDRWEVNEVSSRCQHEVELLSAALDQLQDALRRGSLAELAPLPEILRDTWR
jgi:arylsulfatase A-like enzyme